MSVKEINTSVINLGTGLFGKIAYEFKFKYSKFEFFKLKEEKKQVAEHIIQKYLFSKV